MSQRWQYGSYLFRINPNSFDTRFSVIGDEVRTLTGAPISQPTSVVESSNLNSFFFQPRTKVLSQVSIQNCLCFEYYNGSYYVVNTANDRIDIYNSNFIWQSSISLSALTVKTYKAIDIVSTGIWIASSGLADDKIYKINFSGAIITTNTIAKTANPMIGIQELNGFIFILNGSNIDQYTNSTLIKIDTISLPYIGYSGLSSDSKYLLVGDKDDSNNNIVYHIDTSSGSIINGITTDSIGTISDLTYDGTYFYTLNQPSLLIQKISGNTVMADLFSLEREISTNNFVDLIDDMGVVRRVRTSSFSKQRKQEYEIAFDVSMTIEKVNKG